MSGKVGQWDLKSLCSFFFFPTPLRLILTCQWEMSNAIRRGKDDELKSGRKTAREKEEGEREETQGWAEWRFGGSRRSLTS